MEAFFWKRTVSGVVHRVLPSSAEGRTLTTCAITEEEGAAPASWLAAVLKQCSNHVKTFIGLLSDDPKKPRGVAGDTEDALSSLERSKEWSKSFYLLKPFGTTDAENKQVETLWKAMHTDVATAEADGRPRLHRCHCNDWMHYLCCRHTMLFDYCKGQIKPSDAIMRKREIAHVDKAQKDTIGNRGEKRRIIPGTALTRSPTPKHPSNKKSRKN
mmetsp:Transcript_45565/g.97008  ORF Transcript_45565/g.97008 Transcript_45565/m.97008 type:complete len:214 (-) Transcript_45565:105-746(-)